MTGEKIAKGLIASLLIVFLAITPVLVSAASTTETTTTPLENSGDTGYWILPGRIYSVDFKVKWRIYFGAIVRLDTAEFKAGPVDIKIEPITPDWHLNFGFRLSVYINGQRQWSQDDTWRAYFSGGTKEYIFKLDIDCQGNGVVSYNGQNVAQFQLDQPANIYTSGDSPPTVTKTYRYSCPSDTPGSQNAGNRDEPPAPNNFWDWLTSALETGGKVLITLIFLGGGILILGMFFNQAKQRGLIKTRAKRFVPGGGP